jgi:hypothetical protein
MPVPKSLIGIQIHGFIEGFELWGLLDCWVIDEVLAMGGCGGHKKF